MVNDRIIAEQETASPGTAAGSVPHQEYSHRRKDCEVQAAQLQRKHLWLGNTRIAVFIEIFIQCWITGKTGFPSLYWLLVPIVLFILLVVAHRRVMVALSRAKRAVSLYGRGLARMEDRWAGIGETGEEFKDPLHLYAEDLDILGEGSLFQLLSTSRTNMGKQCLARWLLTHADIQTIQERQASVAELKSRLDFREDLAVSGESERIAAKPEALIAWSREESGLNDGRWWAVALAVLNVATLVFGFMVMWTPFIISLLINGIITSRARHRLEKIFAGIGDTHKDLDSLALLLHRIEVEKFDSPMLQQFRPGFLPTASLLRPASPGWTHWLIWMIRVTTGSCASSISRCSTPCKLLSRWNAGDALTAAALKPGWRLLERSKHSLRLRLTLMSIHKTRFRSSRRRSLKSASMAILLAILSCPARNACAMMCGWAAATRYFW